jgi:LPXTG-motif cell wall-anchored protein
MINDDVIILSGENKKLNMTININENLGNEAQDVYKNLKFLINYSNLNRYTNKNDRTNKNLPETGSEINSSLLLGIGSLLLVEGIFILKRKKTQV